MRRKLVIGCAVLLIACLGTASAWSFFSISVTPTNPKPGDPVTVSWSITNPFHQPLSLTVDYSVAGPCLNTSSSLTVNLAPAGQPGSTQTGTFTYTVPTGSCAGTYTVTAKVVFNGYTVLNTTKTFVVE